MTETGWLMLIALMTGITTIIQCIEMWMLVRSSRRTNELLSDPAPLLMGLMEHLAEDKKFQQEFGAFISWMGQAGIAGVKNTMQEAGFKPPKIKSFGDLLGFLVQMPTIQSAIEAKAQSMVTKAGTEVVKDAWL